MKRKLMPFLFNDEVDDDYKVDQGYEALMDFFMSWTIRFSSEVYALGEPNVNLYAKKILWALLYGIESKFDPTFKVSSVNTYRQWKRIDLCFEIELMVNGKIEPFSLFIENKWYSRVGKDQLVGYSKLIDSFYINKERNIRKILLLADDRDGNIDLEQAECLESSFCLFTLPDLKEFAGIVETGNDIFDEFWIYSDYNFIQNFGN